MVRVQPPTRQDAPFRLRDVALAAYGPTVVNSLGHGAVLPVLAVLTRPRLRAIDRMTNPANRKFWHTD